MQDEGSGGVREVELDGVHEDSSDVIEGFLFGFSPHEGDVVFEEFCQRGDMMRELRNETLIEDTEADEAADVMDVLGDGPELDSLDLLGLC